ncbi:MAG: hypothetical protein R2939_07450 [Kofleriaceae bacterium]
MRTPLLPLLLASACVVTSAPPPQGPPPPPAGTTAPPPPTRPGLSADGRHLAVDRTFRGRCAPAGSRGGCYEITLRADGSYRNLLYDAAIEGSYEISGAIVTLACEGGEPQQLELAPDLSRLGDLEAGTAP